MSKNFIIMADIIKSRNYAIENIHQPFGDLIASCNQEFSKYILSPYTITLGDEFQGVADSLLSAIESIFYLEEECVKRQLKFKLRYIIFYGEIKTPINPTIAHGMLGEGLTQARKKLSKKKKSKHRFYFDLSDDKLALLLERLFLVLEGIIRGWAIKDYPLIGDMINTRSNLEVGNKHSKNRSQIWKRRKHLLVDEYNAQKIVILDLTERGKTA